MEKYYIPELEEFHVGFEYEIEITQYPDKNNWEKQIFHLKSSSVDTVTLLHGYDKLRVKFLDQEDIEDLGWAVKAHGESEDQTVSFTRFQMYYYILVQESTGRLQVWDTRDLKDLFIGTIKNKSELRKLMIQLGI